MTKSKRQSWEHKRKKGYESFVFRYGLLRAGLPFGILMSIALFLFPPPPTILELVVKFVFYTLGVGLFVGVVIWRRNEREYKKLTENDDMA